MPKPLETGVCCWRRWKADMGRVANSTASDTTSLEASQRRRELRDGEELLRIGHRSQQLEPSHAL